MRLACPTCKRVLEGATFAAIKAEFPTLPFCSPRCRGADLGSWLNESFRIAAPGDDDLDDGLAGPRPAPVDDEN